MTAFSPDRRAAREACSPPRRVTLPDGTPTWLVTRYHEVRAFLADPRFSRAIASAEHGLAGPALRMSITEMDRPLHTRIRRLVASGFSVRAVQRVRPFIQRTATGLLDEMIAAAPPADLLAAYAAPLTFAAQCEVLGVPPGDRADVRRWSTARSGQPGTSPEAVAEAELGLHACVALIVDEVRRHPTGRLFDELIVAHDRDGRLDETELHGIAASLFFDGHFLVATQIANAVLDLFASPDRLSDLRSGRAQIEPAVEELIRFDPAINHSMTRVATCDLEIGGRTVRAGESVTASLPACGRDGTVFEHPATLDFDRRAGHRHLAFGRGIHFCLGAHLARAELQIALATLLARLPALQPVGTPEPFTTTGARGVLTLPVSW